MSIQAIVLVAMLTTALAYSLYRDIEEYGWKTISIVAVQAVATMFLLLGALAVLTSCTSRACPPTTVTIQQPPDALTAAQLGMCIDYAKKTTRELDALRQKRPNL